MATAAVCAAVLAVIAGVGRLAPVSLRGRLFIFLIENRHFICSCDASAYHWWQNFPININGRSRWERSAKQSNSLSRPRSPRLRGSRQILADLTPFSARSGRVQYLIHRVGEVVGAGERIGTVLDLKDVYMTIYLPAAQAGQLALGDEARMTLDPFPQYVVPATVSFVATDAQFTPKTVETAEERAKLMFRIKLQIDPLLLAL